MKIKSKLFIMFFITGIIPVVIIGWISINLSVRSLMDKSYDQLESVREIKKSQILELFRETKVDMHALVSTAETFKEAAFDRLTTIQELKKSQVEDYMEEVRSDILILSKSNDVLGLYSQLKQYHDDLDTGPDQPFDVSTGRYQRIYNGYSEFFSNFIKTHGYYDMLLICAEYGHVMFTVRGEKDMGTNLGNGPYKDDAVATTWKQVVRTENTVIEDFSPYTPSGGQQAAFIGAPVYDSLEHLIGLIAFQIRPGPINAIVQKRKGMGETGETYLVGRKAATIEYRSDRIVKQGRVGEKKSSFYIEKALSGESGKIVAEGSTDELEIAAYDPLDIPGFNWAIITTESLEEDVVPKYKGDGKDYFLNYINIYGYYNFFLIHPRGRIFYSVKHGPEYNTNIINGKYADSGLGKLVRKVVETGKFGMADFEPYAPINNEPAAFMAEPLIHDGEIEFIAALQFSTEDINNIMQKREGMGETGETYLIGEDMRMRSDSYTDTEYHSMKASFAGTVEKNGVNTDGAIAALEGKTESKPIRNYKGDKVLSAYTPLEIEDIKWALLAEISEEEVKKPINTLILYVVIACLTVGLIGMTITVFITQSITGPIGQAVRFAKALSRGDMTQQLKMKTRDEVGYLAESLNRSKDDLASMLLRIRQNSEYLAGASEELSAVSTQLANSSEETSASIDTMASAAEQMSVGAHNVSSATEQMTVIMNSIASAVEEMSVSVNNIACNARQGSDISQNAIDMSDAATKTINDLGQSAAEIGEVTEVIRQIAQQTNLLALNATIEAASAGDAGKGFAVVANEIKELANQSGRSAEGIAKRIKGVQAGTEETIQAIRNVSGIIGKINESSDSITQSVEQQSVTSNEISASVQQANDGVRNIASSIAEIAKGTNDVAKNAGVAAQNANEISAGSQQVKTSSRDLAKVAAQLIEMVSRFKVEM
ncbi:MAG: methyl-accepting chemotaxis protein [Desulfobacterales bacterium]|nr:methyl-accepting chemotaxis protein [Desulfobacterales bacterium]